MAFFAVRILVVYAALLVATRIMGKREIGQLSSIDFVVAIVMAELATMPLTNLKMPLLQALAPLALVTVLQVGTSVICLKSNYFRRFLYGRPNVLIADGKMQLGEMRKARYNIDDLLTQLRQRDVFDIGDVDFAILETSGDLTVSLKAQKRLVTMDDLHLQPTNRHGGIPLTLIDDGEVNTAGLSDADLDLDWLMKRLRRRGIHDVREVFFASLSSDGSIYLMKRQQAERAVASEKEIH